MTRHKIFLTVSIIIGCSALLSAEMKNSVNVPGGYTGAEGITCTNCHGGTNSLNPPGGSVVINGLPATYTPGNKYDFTVTINHGTANRTRWGFAMKAVANNNAVGTFTETNPNVYINNFDREIGHSSAPSTPSSNTYTFTNMSWTAPSSPTTAEQNITFYVAANAANGSGSSGDFIYTAVRSMTLTSTSVSEKNLLLDKISTLREGKKVILQISLQKTSSLQIAVVNLNGQMVLSKASQKYSAGTHTLELDGTALASGTYVISVQNEKEKVTGKITL
jgi:hypothetical protein